MQTVIRGMILMLSVTALMLACSQGGRDIRDEIKDEGYYGYGYGYGARLRD